MVRRRRGHEIQAVHIPWSLDEAPRLVTVDRRDATRWYPYVDGGPVEAVHLTFPGLDDHQLYVNSRYASFDPSTVNDHTPALLAGRGVLVAGGEVRGDALLVRSAGRGRFPREVAQEVVDAFFR